MANTKSAMKRILITARQRLRNRSARSAIRTAVRRATALIQRSEMSPAEDAVKAATRALDMSVSRGVLHKNSASRRKSRLMRRLNQTKAPGQG